MALNKKYGVTDKKNYVQEKIMVLQIKLWCHRLNYGVKEKNMVLRTRL
jgi:hypothetical protein